MTDTTTPVLDTKEREELKNEIKAEAVREAQEALISNISGKKADFSWEEKGKKAPNDYNELFAESDRRAEEKINNFKEEMKAEEDAKEQAKLDSDDAKRKSDTEAIEEKRQTFDKEWYELVKEDKLPNVAEELQVRINKGEKLSKEEIMADDGLKARLDLADMVQKTGKSAKLAFYEDFSKKDQPGKTAPVLGGRPRAPQTESKELTREEVVENRKKVFGW